MWVVDRVEMRPVSVMRWVETPADLARRSEQAKQDELWRLWKEANPDAIPGGGGPSCPRNHLDHMPGVKDEEYCAHCDADLGIPPIN